MKQHKTTSRTESKRAKQFRQRGGVIVEAALSMTVMLTLLAGIVGLGSYFFEYQRFSTAVAAATSEFARFNDTLTDPTEQLTKLVAEQLGVSLPADITPEQLNALATDLGISLTVNHFSPPRLSEVVPGDPLSNASNVFDDEDATVLLVVTATRDTSRAVSFSGLFARFLPNLSTTASFVRAGAGSAVLGYTS